MATKLADLREGQTARITRIGGSGLVRQRLLDMGVTRGTPVSLERRAPFGDPIQIHVKGYRLALRKAEACLIEVDAAVDGPA